MSLYEPTPVELRRRSEGRVWLALVPCDRCGWHAAYHARAQDFEKYDYVLVALPWMLDPESLVPIERENPEGFTHAFVPSGPH